MKRENDQLCLTEKKYIHRGFTAFYNQIFTSTFNSPIFNFLFFPKFGVLNVQRCKNKEWKNLEEIIKYKELLENEIKKYEKIIVCNTAWNIFAKLIEQFAGENEKKRMIELQKMVTIVEDKESTRIKNISKTSKISDQYQKVFGTGEYYNCMTFTGNSNYENTGIHIKHKYYPAIQLTEKYI